MTHSKLYILHEYGAPHHYRALAHLARQNSLELEFIEFGIAKNAARSIKLLNCKILFSTVKSLLWLIYASLGGIRKQKIVIGIAPFDWKLFLLFPIIRNNVVYWHTSWPDWSKGLSSESIYPYRLALPGQKQLWVDFMSNQLRHIFFVTELSRASFERHILSLPSTTVYHSYNPKIFYPSSSLTSDKVLKVGFVGRLEWQKGVSLFTEIASNLSQLPISFSAVGAGPLKSLFQSPDVKDIITYGGSLTGASLGDYYRSLDILLIPSLRTQGWEEAFGLVIIEAMASGVVPIATDHSGPRQLLLGELSKHVFPENIFTAEATRLIIKCTYHPVFLSHLRRLSIATSRQYHPDSLAEAWRPVLKTSKSHY